MPADFSFFMSATFCVKVARKSCTRGHHADRSVSLTMPWLCRASMSWKRDAYDRFRNHRGGGGGGGGKGIRVRSTGKYSMHQQ